MKTTEFLVCEGCEQPILKPEFGVIVQGNIFRASLHERAGLVGDNLPLPDAEGRIRPEQIHEVAFCKTCFIKALGWDSKPVDPNAFKLQLPVSPTWANQNG